MSGQSSANSAPKPDTPAAPGENGGREPSSGNLELTSKLFQDSLPERSGTERNTDDKQAAGATAGVSDATRTNDDSSTPLNDSSEEAGQKMRREIEAQFRSPEARKIFNNKSAQLSDDVMAQFGTPDIFDTSDILKGVKDDDSDHGKGDRLEESGTNWLSSVTNWASDTLYSAAEVGSSALNSMLDTFAEAGDWMFEGQSGSARFIGNAPDAIANLNDVSNREFREQYRDVIKGFDYEIKDGAGLDMPENATEDGSVEVAGNKLSVFRTPDGKTFLKRGDRVVAGQKADGSFDLALADDSRANVRISKDGDKYRLDHLERSSGDRLEQRYDNGVFYNYTYDSNGQRRVDASADFREPLTQEQLGQRLDEILRALGPDGTAALRLQQDGQRLRLLIQTHGENTHSITDIEKRRASIFRNGQEYRLNERDQLGRVDSDGRWNEIDTNRTLEDETARLAELARRNGLRANGDGQTEVDGVRLQVDDNGDATITRNDTVTGEQISTTQLPRESDQAIKTTNHQSGETAALDGEKLQLTDRENNTILSFDPDTGFDASQFHIDDQGLTDLTSGLNIDPEGNVYDGDGLFVSGDAGGTDWYFPELDDSVAEHHENMQTSRETSALVSNLGSISLSIARSGNPASVGVARQVAAEALGIASAAISELGNDFLAQIPVYNSQSIAQAAFTQAVREERTQTYAMRMGIFDTARLSEFNRVATMSTTAYTPEEYVNHRLKMTA